MITDYLTSLFSLLFLSEHQFVVMFVSSLISSSLLPGNSEIVFTTIASQLIISERSLYSFSLFGLIAVATIGNTLGSLITFAMGNYCQNLKHKKINMLIGQLTS